MCWEACTCESRCPLRSDLLELEFQVVVSCLMWKLRPKLKSLQCSMCFRPLTQSSHLPTFEIARLGSGFEFERKRQ